MSSAKKERRERQTLKLLKWIQRYPGLWYLICTPKAKEMNPQMMQKLIKRLSKDSLYELIFVMLMVHRNAAFISSMHDYLRLELMTWEWEAGRTDRLLQALSSHLE